MPGFPIPMMNFEGGTPVPGLPGTMFIWLDAADDPTITVDTGGVSLWEDKSGNNNDFSQATTTKRPQKVTNGVQFVGALGSSTNEATIDQLVCTITGTLFSGQECSIFFVADNSDKNAAVWGPVLAATTSSTFYAVAGMNGNTQSIILSRSGGAVGSVVVTTDWTGGARNCVLVQKTNATTGAAARLNGGTAVTGTTGTQGSSVLSIGQERGASGPNPASPLNCILRELIVYRRVLTELEISDVFANMTAKWGPFG